MLSVSCRFFNINLSMWFKGFKVHTVFELFPWLCRLTLFTFESGRQSLLPLLWELFSRACRLSGFSWLQRRIESSDWAARGMSQTLASEVRTATRKKHGYFKQRLCVSGFRNHASHTSRVTSVWGNLVTAKSHSCVAVVWVGEKSATRKALCSLRCVRRSHTSERMEMM